MNYSGLIALVLYIVALIVFLRYEATHEDDDSEEKIEHLNNNTISSPLDLNDEDATIASLVASIECREEYKKNVRVVNVRRIK